MIAKVIVGFVHSWAAGLAAVLVLISFSVLAQEQKSNAIAGIKSVNAGQSYEVMITSEEPFVRSDLPVLKIGDQEITISKAAAPDDDYRQVFILSPEQFGKAKTGDKVAFQWGRGEGRKQLEMGSFDKSNVR